MKKSEAIQTILTLTFGIASFAPLETFTVVFQTFAFLAPAAHSFISQLVRSLQVPQLVHIFEIFAIAIM